VLIILGFESILRPQVVVADVVSFLGDILGAGVVLAIGAGWLARQRKARSPKGPVPAG